MSIHKVDVIRIDKIEPHPNADRLGIVRVGGFVCVVGLDSWPENALACYIQPDSLVDTRRPEFAFLRNAEKNRDFERIRVKKLRGVYSQGLLIPAPEGLKEGDDAAEMLEVTHYEPPLQVTGGESEPTPAGVFNHSYDVENYNRFLGLFNDGEEVIASEKIHGSSLKAAWTDNRLYVGSRNEWKKESDNIYWLGVRKYPQIVDFLKAHPNYMVFGEVYGRVQSLHYGLDNDVDLRLFDIAYGNQWLGWDESQSMAEEWKLPWVPMLYRGPFDEEYLRKIAEGDSALPNAKHLREGIVVKPVVERTTLELGRVQLKIISNRYLEKS